LKILDYEFFISKLELSLFEDRDQLFGGF
jgi:hypothetical protein